MILAAGVVQAAVRNYINLNIGEQLGRCLLLLHCSSFLTEMSEGGKDTVFFVKEIES
jgi:hypothetical protein